jgi:hypothetical protein
MMLVRNTVEDAKSSYRNGTFCPCCGMALRAMPIARRDKERLTLLNKEWNKNQD